MIFKQSRICNVAESIFHLYELVDYDFTTRLTSYDRQLGQTSRQYETTLIKLP